MDLTPLRFLFLGSKQLATSGSELLSVGLHLQMDDEQRKGRANGKWYNRGLLSASPSS